MLLEGTQQLCEQDYCEVYDAGAGAKLANTHTSTRCTGPFFIAAVIRGRRRPAGSDTESEECVVGLALVWRRGE